MADHQSFNEALVAVVALIAESTSALGVIEASLILFHGESQSNYYNES
jgi:hypothetical protein